MTPKQSCNDCAKQSTCQKVTHFENYNIDGCADFVQRNKVCKECPYCVQEESVWLISYDGYYPYCQKCGYEPERPALNVDNRTPFCPNCGRKMRKERD